MTKNVIYPGECSMYMRKKVVKDRICFQMEYPYISQILWFNVSFFRLVFSILFSCLIIYPIGINEYYYT